LTLFTWRYFNKCHVDGVQVKGNRFSAEVRPRNLKDRVSAGTLLRRICAYIEVQLVAKAVSDLQIGQDYCVLQELTVYFCDDWELAWVHEDRKN
jgi:hypothetical protein